MKTSAMVVVLSCLVLVPPLYAGSILTPTNDVLSKQSKYIALATVVEVADNIVITGGKDRKDGQTVTLVIDALIRGKFQARTVTFVVNRPLNALSGESNLSLKKGDTGVWFIRRISADNQITLTHTGRGFARLQSAPPRSNEK